jgi:hypothetical protein
VLHFGLETANKKTGSKRETVKRVSEGTRIEARSTSRCAEPVHSRDQDGRSERSFQIRCRWHRPWWARRIFLSILPHVRSDDGRPHRRRGVDGDDLTSDQPVEQHPHRGELLLHVGRRMGCGPFFHPGLRVSPPKSEARSTTSPICQSR